MNNADPRVSVLMPAYNAGKFIDESIQSVLNQTYDDWELVVVNDCSTDDTVERIQKYDDARIRLIHTPENLKLCRALNYGLKHCKGELVARLDSDDNATPNRLELQVKAMNDNPDWAVVGGYSNTIDENSVQIKSWTETFRPTYPEVVSFSAAFKNIFRHSAATFRRSVIEQAGGYPEWMDIEDYALWSKLLCENHRLANLAVPLCEYRVHGGSIMVKATAAAVETKAEPRRPMAQEIYTRCARHIGLSESRAERWGELWVRVRLPISGESISVAELHDLLSELASNRPIGTEFSIEVKKVLSFAYGQLFRVAKRQGNFIQCFKIGLAACFQVGPLKIAASLLR